MKIVKATDNGTEEQERSLVPVTEKEKIKEVPQAVGSFFSTNKKRIFVALAAVLIISSAVALNWILFGGNKDYTPPADDPSGNVQDNSYFAMATLDRQRARDEALEVLQSVASSADASAEDKSAALASISIIANNIQKEANIETLIKAKNFTNCIAVINGENATITVESDGLLANELAQIWEIVYIQAGILPINCTINEHAPVAANPTDTAAE